MIYLIKYLIKRHPAEFKIAVGYCLLINAVYWAKLLDQTTPVWNFDTTTEFGRLFEVWFRRNGLAIMFIAWTLSVVGSVVFLAWGWLLRRRHETEPPTDFE